MPRIRIFGAVDDGGTLEQTWDSKGASHTNARENCLSRGEAMRRGWGRGAKYMGGASLKHVLRTFHKPSVTKSLYQTANQCSLV